MSFVMVFLRPGNFQNTQRNVSWERVAENTRKENVIKSSRIMLSSEITDAHSQDLNHYRLVNMRSDQHHMII